MNESHTNPSRNLRSDYHWLAPLFLRRPGFAERVLRARKWLAELPQSWRTVQLRRLGLSLSAAALLLALAGPLAKSAARAEADVPTNTIAVVNGLVNISADSKCSLIEAIVNANDTKNGRPHTDCAAGNPSGADTITLPSNGQFTLTAIHNTGNQGKNGLPWITSAVTIVGNNATIGRASSAPAFRLFAVGQKGTLTLDGMTLTGGKVDWTDELDYYTEGAAIFTHNEVWITNSHISSNDGDAIFLRQVDDPNPRVVLRNSTVSDNSRDGVDGYSPGESGGPHISIYYSEISNNSGGISMSYGYVNVYHSTISNNRGPGVDLNRASARISDSTISSNGGRGVALFEAGATIRQSTITMNGDTGVSAGLYSGVDLIQSIVSGNGRQLSPADGIGAEIETGYESDIYDRESLFGHSGLTADQAFSDYDSYYHFTPSSRSIDATVDGEMPTPLNFIIDTTLRNNGGPTLTHTPVVGSPAIDAVRSYKCIGSHDQRGTPFLRDMNGNNAVSNSECDIGAIEVQPAPSVTTMSPSSGAVGTNVIVRGVNFIGVSSVAFNGVAAVTFSVSSATQLIAVVPPGATTGKVSVTTPQGTATSAENFIVATPVPTITDFTPTSGPAGTTVIINGANLTGAMSVKFNGTAAASYTVNSATQIAAVVPAGATSGKISVTTPGGTATTGSGFSVTIPAPVISSVAPNVGTVGAIVTIVGEHLTGTSAVRFNGITAVFSQISPMQVNTRVPHGATTGKITVTTPGGVATSTVDFTVLPGERFEAFIPAITR